MKPKLTKHWIAGETAIKSFDTAQLQDTDELKQFKITFNDRFQALQDLLDEEGTTMEDNWKGITEALTSTCQGVLGDNKVIIGNSISIGTLFWIQERKNKKIAINNS
ncbi:unnamed protein product [Schistosoma curassoni]|uniref:ABC transporter ATP-binding protein n=1 Tax=Schistosoma curassoni TaxID=6186 RepID=A0A183JC60_9TREM|nr:unnamed protein product [Schistosoma curassoni]